MKYMKFKIELLAIIMLVVALAAGQSSPGGTQNNLSLWLKADAGVSCSTNNCGINLWSNQQGNTSWDAQGTGDAVWLNSGTNLLNFNSTVSFTDDAQPFKANNITRANGTASTVFVVGMVNVINDKAFFEFRGGGARAFFIDRRYASNNNFATSMGTGATRVWSITDTGGSNSYEVFEDTKRLQARNSKNNTSWTTANFVLGDDDTGGNRLTGNISEILYYDRLLTAVELSRVHSYIAIKYGISIDDGIGGDYVASNWNGTTGVRFWNATTNTGFNNDVFGIGRDDSSALNQRVSKSVNADDIVSISLDNDFISNTQSAARTAALDNLDFLMVGNNNGNFNVSTTAIASLSPDLKRINRVWRVQDTGSVDCVYYNFNTISFTKSPTQAWYIVIADDASFTANVAYQQITTGGNTLVRLNLNDNSANNYITLARLDRAQIANTFDAGIVGINTQTPAANTYLDIRGGNQGMVITRLTQTAINAMTAVEGMLVFNTTANTFQLYNGSIWRNLGDAPPPVSKFCNYQ